MLDAGGAYVPRQAVSRQSKSLHPSLRANHRGDARPLRTRLACRYRPLPGIAPPPAPALPVVPPAAPVLPAPALPVAACSRWHLRRSSPVSVSHRPLERLGVDGLIAPLMPTLVS